MSTNGILLHVYHLGAKDWERLTWGDPSADKLGTVSKFAHTILGIPASDHVISIVYCGPSLRDGLNEGTYTKRFLLDRINQLSDFPSLRRLISNLSSEDYGVFVRRIHELTVGPVIKNTVDEVMYAAEFLNKECVVGKVYQVAAPSHAPRCLKNQLLARRDGIILQEQPWHIVASDISFSGSELEDVVILEPPHRGDDPMVGFSPSLANALKPYFTLSTSDKQRLINEIQDTLSHSER